jgi:hypothetical protein
METVNKELNMADAYGAVVLSMSDDCRVNEALLLQKLNELDWCNEDREWSVENHSFFYSSQCQYPTVCFTHPITVNYADVNGNHMSVPFAEATEEQFDASEGDYDYEDMPLSHISHHFKDCIRSGSIEIAATCNEKSRYVQYESLTIHADMSVSFVSHHVGTSPDYSTYHKMEEYSLGD